MKKDAITFVALTALTSSVYFLQPIQRAYDAYHIKDLAVIWTQETVKDQWYEAKQKFGFNSKQLSQTLDKIKDISTIKEEQEALEKKKTKLEEELAQMTQEGSLLATKQLFDKTKKTIEQYEKQQLLLPSLVQEATSVTAQGARFISKVGDNVFGTSKPHKKKSWYQKLAEKINGAAEDNIRTVNPELDKQYIKEKQELIDKYIAFKKELDKNENVIDTQLRNLSNEYEQLLEAENKDPTTLQSKAQAIKQKLGDLQKLVKKNLNATQQEQKTREVIFTRKANELLTEQLAYDAKKKEIATTGDKLRSKTTYFTQVTRGTPLAQYMGQLEQDKKTLEQATNDFETKHPYNKYPSWPETPYDEYLAVGIGLYALRRRISWGIGKGCKASKRMYLFAKEKVPQVKKIFKYSKTPKNYDKKNNK